jgi:hypothetical protein
MAIVLDMVANGGTVTRRTSWRWSAPRDRRPAVPVEAPRLDPAEVPSSRRLHAAAVWPAPSNAMRWSP